MPATRIYLRICFIWFLLSVTAAAPAAAMVDVKAVAAAGRTGTPGAPDERHANIGPVRAMASAGRALYVRNECGQDLNVALHYADLDGNWTSDGWWLYRAGASSYPVDDDGLPLRSRRALVYLSARHLDGREAAWYAGERTEHGAGIAMHEAPVAVDTDGDYVVSIVCE